METPVYTERQVMRFRLPLVLVGVAVMLYGAYLNRHGEPHSALIMVFFAMVFAVVLWGITVFNIVVTPTELRFGFPIYRKRFPLAQVAVGDVERIALIAGIGIHFWAGKWVYNARYGRGVNIKHGRFRFLLGSNQPEHLQNTLMQLVPRSPVPT